MNLQGIVFKCSLFLILFLNLKVSYSQSNRFLNIGLGAEIQSQRDAGMSPMKYNGGGLFAQFGFEKETLKKANYLYFNLMSSSLSNINGNAISEMGGKIAAFSFYNNNSDNYQPIQLGWSNRNVFVLREIPSFGNYSMRTDYFTSFGPAANFRKPFYLFKQMIDFQLVGHFQVLGFYIRPSLATAIPDGYLDNTSVWKGFWQSINLFYPGKNLNFGVSPKLIYEIGPGNRLSLSYEFDFYKLNSIEPVTHASGVWNISLSTRLSKLK